MMAQQAGTGGPLHALPNGSFLYSQFTPHKIVLFDMSSTPGNGWVARTLVSTPELFEEIGTAVVRKTIGEDGQTYSEFASAWPHSMAVFQLPNGDILNIVDFGDEDRWLWQIFGTTDSAKGNGAVLIAQASLDLKYIPRFMCQNGDILATTKDPATGVYSAVRLRLTVAGSPATPSGG